MYEEQEVLYQTYCLLNDFSYYKLTTAQAYTHMIDGIFRIPDKTNCQRLFLIVRVNEIILIVAYSSLDKTIF